MAKVRILAIRNVLQIQQGLNITKDKSQRFVGHKTVWKTN